MATRRSFVMGCSAAIAAMSNVRLGLTSFSKSAGDKEILVVVFLRGAMDGLSFMPPLAGADRTFYEVARPDLAIPDTSLLPLDASWGLHPATSPLHDLYLDNRLALVHAVGMPSAPTRSHFDAMEFIERGTPGDKTTTSGWLSRHLDSIGDVEAMLRILAVADSKPSSLLGRLDTLTFSDPGNFNLDAGPYAWRGSQRLAMRRLFGNGSDPVRDAGLEAMRSADIVEAYVSDTYSPANGASYPADDFGDQLQVLAQLVKLDLGLEIATLDYGGWDTHETQIDYNAPESGYFANRIGSVAQGLAAFYQDLDGAGGAAYTNRLTVVVLSEFGRRLRENANRGTDHGQGNRMMVLGGNVNGGLYGNFPGLDTAQLFDNADLAVTTDFRQVLTEILIRRLCNNKVGEVFPGFNGYSPLGVVQGIDLTPDYSWGPVDAATMASLVRAENDPAAPAESRLDCSGDEVSDAGDIACGLTKAFESLP